MQTTAANRDHAAPAHRRAPRQVGLLVVVGFCALFAAWSAPRLDDPFGDSHDGTNAAVWGSTSRAIREDGVLESRLGARFVDDLGEYAHHPPLISVETALAESVLGERPWATRLPALLSTLAAMPLLYLLARRMGVGDLPAAFGVVVASSSPMLLTFGTMVDTLEIALPWTLGLLLLACRPQGSREHRGLVVLVAAVVVVTSWQAMLLAWILGLALAGFGDPRQRGIGRAVLGGAGVGTALVAAWALWATGSFHDLAAQFTHRAGNISGMALSTEIALHVGRLTLLSLLTLALGTWGCVIGLRAGATRLLMTVVVATGLGYVAFLHQAAVIHEYWTYWFLVPLGLGAALALDRLWRAGLRARALAIARLLAALVTAPLPTSARHDIDVGLEAVSAADALPEGQTMLFVAGHVAKDAAWLSYAARRPVRTLPSAAAASDAARSHPGARVLVGCWNARPPWLASVCTDPGRSYRVVEVDTLAREAGQ